MMFFTLLMPGTWAWALCAAMWVSTLTCAESTPSSASRAICTVCARPFLNRPAA